ncbi:MAG: 23S rRNA (pseudouridine(1915)-N(3))-methyltransferase RlmH [Desulfotomaculaceae bacterium]|nr:23S rRNA (pseudouridine(1915)-N(3))-methyltransferase RlmH [Desulfotomaculaceae bacterium]
MFHITILAVGRLKERYLSEACAEYLKRLSAYARVSTVEVEDEGIAENLTAQGREKVKQKEGERILRRLRPGTFVIVLEPRGKTKTSEDMSEMLDKLALDGRGELAFIIGGSLGLSPAVLERADLKLSFSKFTFPHQLMRVILLEQVYRWFKISRGEPYHH